MAFPTEPPPSQESPFMRALKSLQDAMPPPAFTLPSIPSVASILDAIPPPAFTLPPMPTFPTEPPVSLESPFQRLLESIQPSAFTLPPVSLESPFQRLLESIQPPAFTLPPVSLESPVMRALESLQERSAAMQSVFAQTLESPFQRLLESIQPPAFTLPPVSLESPVMRALESLQERSAAMQSVFAQTLESPFQRLLESIQPPAFTLPPVSLESPVMRALESLQETIQPPTFTLPPMPMSSDERELTTISRLVMPSELRRPSTKTDRSLMLEVYDQIFEFENNLRRFIDGAMTKAYGSDWIKHGIPGDMRKEWKDRRDRALKAGMKPCPLIDYADFGDYEKIILRRDNWETVFKSHFPRKEFVQESFQRIHPVRRSTMHCRIITIYDRLFLTVEVRRFLMLIGRKSSGMC